MNLALTEEQILLRETLSRFFADLDRRLSDDESLWRMLAKTLGILGAPLSESVGGLGGGAIETMIVMEEFGAAQCL